MGTNFPHGSLVMRIFRFDGSSELLGKFQYFDDAKMFAHALHVRDIERNDAHKQWFYIAVCDNANEALAFGVSPTKSEGETT